MTVLVTCGHTRPGLSAVRALGRAGRAVAVGAPHRPALAQWSRFATSTFLLPDAADGPERFAEAVAREATGRSAEVVLACSDAAWWALARFRKVLPAPAQRLMPPQRAVARSLDRSALFELAESLDIACVPLLRVDGRAPVEPVLRKAANLRFPVLVRPLVSWVELEDGSRRLGEQFSVHSIADLRRLLYANQALREDGCLIESRPDGLAVGYAAVVDSGVPVAEICQERMHEESPFSQQASWSRTIVMDPAIRDQSQRLLAALSWQGPVKIEWLRGKDGVPRLVSVIGRLWGSLQLSIAAGVNVPRLCEKLAAGELSKDEPALQAEPGHRLRWIMGDLRQSVGAAGRGLARFHKRDGRKALWRAGLELMQPLELWRHETDVWAADDPMPFIQEVQARARSTVLGAPIRVIHDR